MVLRIYDPDFKALSSSSWLVSTHLKKYARQIGSFPQVGMNRTNI